MAIALIEANKEPTNHLLRDMSGMKDDFENLGVPLYFVFKDADHQAKFNRADFRAFPSVMRWGTDLDGRLLKGFGRRIMLDEYGEPAFDRPVEREGRGCFCFPRVSCRVGYADHEYNK